MCPARNELFSANDYDFQQKCVGSSLQCDESALLTHTKKLLECHEAYLMRVFFIKGHASVSGVSNTASHVLCHIL